MISKTLFWMSLFLGFGSPALAESSLTEGKAFLPWLWEDQARPTLQVAGKDRTGYGLLIAGSLATLYAHGEDAKIYDQNLRERLVPDGPSQTAAFLGSGGPFIALALGQTYFDRDNGLAHLRALALTSLNHITLAFLIQRERPNGSNSLSFPSGHSSSIFASATSLGYAYGPWAAVPAYAVATFVALGRVSDQAHWLSDVVGGATLGIFWGRASALAGRQDPTPFAWQVLPHEDGALIQWSRTF